MSVQLLEAAAADQLRVFELGPADHRRWEEFVLHHSDGTVFQLPGWIEALRREYDRQLLCLGCEDLDGNLRGVLPLLETRGLPFRKSPRSGRRWSSLPRTPVAGPLSLGSEPAVLLLNAAARQVRSRSSGKLELKPVEPRFDGLVEGVEPVPWRRTYVLRLPRPPLAVRFGTSKNHSRIEWSVRKATRLGVTVRSAGSEADLRNWYRLYLDTLRDRAVPPRPFRFFRSVWDIMRPMGMLRLLLAEQRAARRTVLLSGSIFLGFGQRLFYSFSGSRRDRQSLSLRPNDLILYKAIQDAQASGFQELDFGEVTDSTEGLAQFKSKWGAEERWLHRYYCPPLRGLKAERPPTRLDQLGDVVWRKLPLALTRSLGNWLYGYM